MLRNLLIYRMAIFNACAFACVGWAWQRGYVESVFSGDVSRLSYVIAALFLIGLISCFNRAAKVSRLLNLLKEGRLYYEGSAGGRKPVVINGPKLIAKSAHVGRLITWLVVLGLIGTVWGFKVALSGIDFTAAMATAQGAQAAGVALTEGVGVAINTTIVGSVLSLWLDVNFLMLSTATSCLIEDSR